MKGMSRQNPGKMATGSDGKCPKRFKEKPEYLLLAATAATCITMDPDLCEQW
jgi:hypothetical protein